MEDPISYAKHHKYIMGGLAIIVILTTAIGARLIGKDGAKFENIRPPKVSVVSAKDYMKDRGTIMANGTVESLEQADLRSQAAGTVTKVYAQIGQKVSRGQTLVTLQNTEVVAQLAQAKAFLKSQQARLDEMKKGIRTEQINLLEARLNAAKQGLADTKAAQDTLVNNAYSAFLNAGLSIIGETSNQSEARLTLSGSYQLLKEGTYKIVFPQGGPKPPFSVFGLEEASGWADRSAAQPIGQSGLFFTLSEDGSVYPGDSWTITIPNPQSPTYSMAKNNYEAALKGRDVAVNSASNALSAIQKEYDLMLAGATTEQIRAQEAAVEQAAANVQLSSALMEKTIIRSPIDGVVGSLTVKYGELVSPGTLVATVASKGGLQIKAFISDYDLPFVEQGAEAMINESAKGKVSQIAQSIDPYTKNVEIKVIVTDKQGTELVVGQNAKIKIAAKNSSGSGTVFILPIQSVKVSNSGASIFTVTNSKIEEKNVKLGAVIGEFVEVVEGLTPDTQLVSAVYDLKAGQEVSME